MAGRTRLNVDLVNIHNGGDTVVYSGGAPIGGNHYDAVIFANGRQISDATHPLWLRRKKLRIQRDIGTGGIMQLRYIEKQSLFDNANARTSLSPLNFQTLNGTVAATTLGLPTGWPIPPSAVGSISVPDITGYGATAYMRMKPDKPVADLGQFIGELRELPRAPMALKQGVQALKDSAEYFYRNRHLWKGVRNQTKNLAGDYLNYEFGWKPFLKDFRTFLDIPNQVIPQLEQLMRDNGKPVRRRLTLYSNVDTKQQHGYSSYAGSTPSYGTSFYQGTPTSERLFTQSKKVWASGRFRYWIPNINQRSKQFEICRKLLGLQLSPSLVWNLTPWSWLADWFGNIGDVMSNISSNAADNLTMDYLYLMCHESFRIQSICTIPFRNGNTATPILITQWGSKQRLRGSPYGFGKTDGDFTARQHAILAALGIRFWS